MELIVNERQGIVVWVYSLRHLKTLKRFGLIHYVSKRMKYVILYINEAEMETAEKKLANLHFVRRIELSYRPSINMDFKDVLDKACRQNAEDKLADFQPVELKG